MFLLKYVLGLDFKAYLVPKLSNTFEISQASGISRHSTGAKNLAIEATLHAHVIFCMIFTTPEQWQRKALAVKLTWAKRCDYYAFFYSKRDDVQLDGAYALDVPEGRDHLTGKTMEAFRISYKQYSKEVDWYLKADDDTYVIMENLRHFLHKYDPAKRLYLGHTSSDFLRKGYNSGGAGYTLSKAAAQALFEDADKFPTGCVADGGIEDLDIGRCLETLRYVFPHMHFKTL